MILIILDWVGTIFIVFGSFIITLKKAFKPKVRFIAISSYLVSNIVWMPFAFLLGRPGLFVTQIILFIINLNGIFNCSKEIKIKKKGDSKKC